MTSQKNSDRQQSNIHLVKVEQNSNTGQVEFLPLGSGEESHRE
ncbi:hypothetical protein [Tolypothrix sp. VBCCA 56010]